MKFMNYVMVGIVAGVVALYLSFSPLLAQADETSDCGGIGEKTCQPTSATHLVDKWNPNDGNWSVGNNSDGVKHYYSCPEGYEKNPTRKWRHPSKACKDGKERSAAIDHGPEENAKPDGSFYNMKTKAYYTCPPGYTRNIGTKIEADNACRVKTGGLCDGNNIAIREKCYKRGECGEIGQRMCNIREGKVLCKIKKGSFPDFRNHKCVPKNTGLCLYMVRAANAASRRNPLKDLIDAVKETKEEAIKSFPGFDKITKNVPKSVVDAVVGYAVAPANLHEETLNPAVNDILETIGEKYPELKQVKKDVQSHGKRMADYLTSDNFCYDSRKERESKLNDLGLKMTSTIRSHKFRKKPPADAHNFFAIGLVGQYVEVAGVVGSVFYATNFDGLDSFFAGFGPAVSSNVSGDVMFTLAYFPEITMDQLEGWGSSLGFDVPTDKIGKFPFGTSFDAIFSSNFNQVLGVGVGFTYGFGKLPVDVDFTYIHNWKLN